MSVAQSVPVDRDRYLDPARGVLVSSALGAFMWGALAGIVWFFA
jgi:hypothetical protein